MTGSGLKTHPKSRRPSRMSAIVREAVPDVRECLGGP